jgi:hypothetical protein
VQNSLCADSASVRPIYILWILRVVSLGTRRYNKRWQGIVNFGKSITTDESRVAGWYHSVMTIGPEPKPIRTGATLHTVCVTHGLLSTYKLFARTYGGKGNEDIN